MQDVNFLVREPLLDPKQRILGYELSWRRPDGSAVAPGDEDAAALAQRAAEALNDAEGHWLLGENILFLQATPGLLAEPALRALLPQKTVLCVNSQDLDNPDFAAAIKELRGAGYGVALTDAESLVRDKNLLLQVSRVEIRFGEADFASQARIYAALKQTSMRVIGRGVSNWKEFDSCASLGVDTFVGNLYATARPGVQATGLNPVQSMILQLMDMVRKNTDVRQLEAVLKRDAALSYKLLTYINSAGFGLGTEIQSLRHAVTMLGYSPLYRWLSVLLATAGTAAQSPVLMQTAVVRGRFVELLGKSMLPKNEAENLFVVGMFSLLDRLLNMSMEQALENIPLSEQVNEALLKRQGIYGPFLSLAEACEKGNDAAIGNLADSLFVSPAQVNAAHLEALTWAQSLKL
ncbi:EAL and modified HD-GYP domain-containing signal transduction protein [Paucimonas lemoignei]|uniref:EAL and modified HD-GYP domain-containing signal transduction protein n=1 Tax=Paucimonas lemoignei TaxID=29443 RepID=A0A4R3I0D9_PAULE|nr:HDOD domain-containing protein [Paucimonas lemoignei]TCS39147.1 EAL and modified HD-GYP domain-containing signal transduction protein [Paucimonas lemoignei]